MVALVRAVYFDTSVLRTMPFRAIAHTLEPLRAICNEFDVAMLTPEICVRELVGYHVRSLTEQLASLKTATNRLRPYLSHGADPPSPPQCMSPVAIRRSVEGDLAASEINVVPLPHVDVGELVDMAIERRPPFDDRGRGFRDALILETICNHARNFEGQLIVVATLDRDFAQHELARRGDANKVIIKHAAGPEAAAVLINEESINSARVHHAQQAELVVALLERHRGVVLAQLRSLLTPSERFLLKGARFRGPDHEVPKGDPFILQFSSVARIENCRFGAFGAGSLFDTVFSDKRPEREYFGVTVEAEFDVVVAVPRLLESTRFTLPSEEEPGGVLRPAYDRDEKQFTVKRVVPFTVSVQRLSDGFEDPCVERCGA